MARTVGSKNKVPASVAEEIACVYEMCDGRHGMARWAKGNPDAFYRIYSALAPKQLVADVTGDLSIQLISHRDNDTAAEPKD